MLQYTDDNHAQLDNLKLTIRPKRTMFSAHGAVKTRIYASPPDDRRAKNKANLAWVRDNMISPVLAALSIDGTASFSSKAGCSCGCSPGFILKTDKQPRFDLWIDWT